jgi:hypothetical protein
VKKKTVGALLVKTLILASLEIQLTNVLEGLFGRPREREQPAMSEARKIGEILDHIIKFRDAYPDVAGEFIDVKYSELVSDPLAVVRRIYGRLDIQSFHFL